MTPGRASFAMNCLLARRLVSAACASYSSSINLKSPQRGCEGRSRPMPANRSGGGGFDQGLKAARIARDTIVVWGGNSVAPMSKSNPDAGRSLGRDHPTGLSRCGSRAAASNLASLMARPTSSVSTWPATRACPRPARDHPASARIRSHETDLPFPGRDFRLTDVHGRRREIVGLIHHRNTADLSPQPSPIPRSGGGFRSRQIQTAITGLVVRASAWAFVSQLGGCGDDRFQVMQIPRHSEHIINTSLLARLLCSAIRHDIRSVIFRLFAQFIVITFYSDSNHSGAIRLRIL